MEEKMKKLFLLVVVMGFVLSTLPTAIAYAETGGANLLEERCTVCHPSSRPKSKQKTPEQWETTVNRMMGKVMLQKDIFRKILKLSKSVYTKS